ncbi:hypothetical protein L1D37_13615 [Vibrio sp. Isolate33]|uniref:hypothetical protein n=1 Tax=Vibrio sp. Isolate33 TaxID=2908539 RepID=UPI001EFC7969|nr:hypothetical protein [Vibrio sp. Isolate33]MCG9544804.1 hypothetical protein [Vibrio sp. Isolate33]
MNCIAATQDGYLKVSTALDCQFVMLSKDEYAAYISSTQSLDINAQLYSTVSGWILFSFVSGHVLGRILKSLGKG